MIDRFGHRVNIGWAEHEDLWLAAANTLDRHARNDALRDIASLTGRSFYAVADRARRMRERARIQAEAAAQRHVMRLPSEWSLAPSSITAPSRERLMAGR